MAEGVTLLEEANRQRWCMADVEPGQEDWPKNASWHPLQGTCKRRGARKIDGEWRCNKHLPKEGA